MASTIYDNFQLDVAKALDNRQGLIVSGIWTGFPSRQAILDAFPLASQRHDGQTFPALDETGQKTEYWFSGGILNENLVPKLDGATPIYSNNVFDI